MSRQYTGKGGGREARRCALDAHARSVEDGDKWGGRGRRVARDITKLAADAIVNAANTTLEQLDE